MKEISNIISGAYLKTLSDNLDLSLVESIPDIATDMAQATIDSVLIDFAHAADNAITVNMEMVSSVADIRGDFYMIFDAASAEKILNAVRSRN